MNFQELGPAHREPFLQFIDDLRQGDGATYEAHFDRAWSPVEFDRFVRASAAERLDWRPKARQTARTRYLLLDQDAVVGFGLLQFPLAGPVVDNFIFIVPPSRRGRGFGTLTLNRLLFEGARAGLARAAVSCLKHDAAALACIASNRGIWDRDVGSRASFWIPLR